VVGFFAANIIKLYNRKTSVFVLCFDVKIVFLQLVYNEKYVFYGTQYI
jgi:hypothetical protein